MPIVNAYIVIQLVTFIDKDLNVTGGVLGIVLGVGTALVFLFAAGAVYRFCVAVGESIACAPRMANRGFDISLIRIGAHALGFVAVITIVVQGVQRLGADVLPLLAGLGVGGLAVALAVRPTLENMIGGLILYADRPIRVGDYCTFSGQSGTVERIGLRSTRIRALDRTLVTVPNSVFADMQLINWARCDKMLVTTVIGLRYETTPEQMRHVLARMRQLCFAHPKIENESLRVRFSGFGASSLDVTVRVYALTNEWNEYHAIREDLYLRFAEAIEASGTSVAFPSSTLYVGRDSGLDPNKIEAAEREVAAWRDAESLPFPLTPEPLATRIADTLDYPPKGSPGAAGRRSVTVTEERLSDSDADDDPDQNETKF
jgi:MscS family membrane protein